MGTVEQVVDGLKKVLDETVALKSRLVADLSKVAEAGRKQEEIAKVQDSRAGSLDDRESAVSKIEDIVTYRVAADEVVKQSNEGRIALENAKNGFAMYKKEETARIVARKEEVSKQEALYKRELAALKKAKEDLAVEVAGIKAKVLGELAQKV